MRAGENGTSPARRIARWERDIIAPAPGPEAHGRYGPKVSGARIIRRNLAAPKSPCPDLVRASTSWICACRRKRKSWMAGPSPAKALLGVYQYRRARVKPTNRAPTDKARWLGGSLGPLQGGAGAGDVQEHLFEIG